MKRLLALTLIAGAAFAFGADIYKPDLASVKQKNVETQLDGNETVLKFYSSEKNSTLWSLRLSPEIIAKLEGKVVYLTGLVSYEDVTAKPKHWNGVKLMLGMTMGDGKDWNPAANIPTGNSDGWTRFNVKIDLTGKKVKKGTLLLGLENVGGIVEYKDVRIVDAPVK